MFDKLKQLQQMKELQDSVKRERFETEKDGIKIVLNGAFEIEEITLNLNLDKSKQETVLKDCLNEVIKKVQLSIAKKFSGML